MHVHICVYVVAPVYSPVQDYICTLVVTGREFFYGCSHEKPGNY